MYSITGYNENERIASMGFNTRRYPKKARSVIILVKGTATAIPTKLPGIVSSLIKEFTTVPGWVLLKKLKGIFKI